MNRCKMSFRKYRHGMFLALLIFPLLFHMGLAYGRENAPLIGYQAPGSGTAAEVVLYYRYANSGLLGQEIRNITIPHTQRKEVALVQALLDGPGRGTSSFFKPLFPAAAEVLSVIQEGDQLFVTFNEELTADMQGDEGTAIDGGSQAVLRRKLMIASLVNTLTETGQYKSVQVLMMSPAGVTASMRLTAQIFLEDSDAPLPPFTRQEEVIITAGKAADYALGLWQQQRFDELQRYTFSSPGSNDAGTDFAQLPALLSWHASLGSYSPDGTYAIVTLSAQVMDREGLMHDLAQYPLRLEKQDGAWKLNAASLRMLTEGLE